MDVGTTADILGSISMERSRNALYFVVSFLSLTLSYGAAAANRADGVEHIIVVVEGANDEWTPTPIELSTGDMLISFATGSVKIGRSSNPVGPEGERDGHGALQMKVGTTNVRTIGTRAIVQEPRGLVKLRIFDTAFTDNTGRFQVELIKVPAAAIPPPKTFGEPHKGLDRGLASDLIDVVDANPLDAGAPMALTNACVVYEKLSATEEASACRARLKRDYPDGKASPELLTAAYVKREVSRSLSSIKACYEKVLRRDQTAEGQVTLSWTIVPDGAVRNIGVKVDTVRNLELVNCMRTTVTQWRFAPLPGGPIDVQFPFKFKAGAVN
jgi:hypothetical protein